ncbi:zinc finger Y-chromosomal protein-like [Anticarsia gemmatalis]|uniref:zinc finger Y-chromosomal protein-like n=1 Tax=Anticarsia gemmatalis TaxID=129554 RepID=UPI003F77427D
MHLTSLICTNCIPRLRDATSFRMMVVSTEKQLLDAVSTDDKEAIFVSVEEDTLDMEVGVKREGKEETAETHTDDDTLDYESDFISGVKIEAHTITKLVENYEISEAKRTARRHYVTEKLAHIINASTFLEHSNVTAFRSKSRQGFPCFYCRNICDNIGKLREHAAQHKKPEIQKVLKTYGPECLVVYVDITNLKCTLCDTNIQNLNELKSHLTNVHKKKMYLEYSDRVIPFKLSDEPMYECQICGFKYETFGAIERHMNVHFRNYVCKECGTGFVTRYRLKVHTKSMHTDGTHPCQICGKIFSTNQKHKNHVNSVHKLIKRFKCTKCPERFGEYFTRQKHMVQVHGVAPLKYKCNVCEEF